MCKIIDLFSGAGGMTLGFVDKRYCGGFNVVAAIDNDKDSVKSYLSNFGNHVVCKNIEQYLMEDEIPQVDCVIGGPPCQGFSLLNRNKNGDIRRSLWKPYLDVVLKSQAKIFVIENVRWLANSEEYYQIKKYAEEIGFNTECAVLNAADYGVPQQRFRAFIIGWSKNFKVDPTFPPRPTHRDPKETGTLPLWLTVRDAIHDLGAPSGTEIKNAPAPFDLHFGRNPTELSKKRYKLIPPGGNRIDLQKKAPELTPKCWINKKGGGTDLFGRLWWDRPSVTIRTEFFKPEKGRYLHPESHRPITHREAARLMGFPDDFIFVGSKISIARQIGNAVPPPLAGSVAKIVKKYLSLLYKSNNLINCGICNDRCKLSEIMKVQEWESVNFRLNV